MKESPRQVLATLAANGLKPGAISLPVEIRKDDASFEKDLVGLAQAAAFAAAIGCPRMGT